MTKSEQQSALRILDAINNHFSGDTQNPLYPEAQILEGDISIKEAIRKLILRLYGPA